MTSFSRKIKNYLYSNAAPEFLFSFYFNRLATKNRQQLSAVLNSGRGMIDHLTEEQQAYWKTRIDDVLQGPDNKDIPRVEKAGTLANDQLIMHNGLVIDPLSYYNFPLLKMLIDNKGVHEPQEEKIFQEVLKSLLPQGKMTMLELGAYWSFYSMWFMQTFPDANCYMVEPDRRNLFYGKENLRLNQMQGTFIHSGIGHQKVPAQNITTVDEICREQKIDFIDVLHSDIQGFELEMLQGSEATFSAKKVGYVFISTHSNELHYDCLKWLQNKYHFSLVASADLEETYSWDGILVLKSPDYKGIEQVAISRKIKSTL